MRITKKVGEKLTTDGKYYTFLVNRAAAFAITGKVIDYDLDANTITIGAKGMKDVVVSFADVSFYVEVSAEVATGIDPKTKMN